MTAAAPPARTVPRRTWIPLAVILLGVATSLLDTAIVNVALPPASSAPRSASVPPPASPSSARCSPAR
jgi:hypothetical protein